MPSKTERQARFFAKAANDQEFRRKHGISKEMADEYFHADRKSGLLGAAARHVNQRKKVMRHGKAR